jgi:hypothetical protein
VLPPPWIQTITGSRAAPVGTAPFAKRGVQTFSVRQSSSPTTEPLGPGTPPIALAYCGQGGPKTSASRVALQRSGGRGARQRRSPTGGAANGMPSQAWLS